MGPHRIGDPTAVGAPLRIVAAVRCQLPGLPTRSGNHHHLDGRTGGKGDEPPVWRPAGVLGRLDIRRQSHRLAAGPRHDPQFRTAFGHPRQIGDTAPVRRQRRAGRVFCGIAHGHLDSRRLPQKQRRTARNVASIDDHPVDVHTPPAAVGHPAQETAPPAAVGVDCNQIVGGAPADDRQVFRRRRKGRVPQTVDSRDQRLRPLGRDPHQPAFDRSHQRTAGGAHDVPKICLSGGCQVCGSESISLTTNRPLGIPEDPDNRANPPPGRGWALNHDSAPSAPRSFVVSRLPTE